MIKVGNVELSEQEASKIVSSDRHYIVTYSKIYDLRYSHNAGFHYLTVYSCPVKGEHLTRRGRFYLYDAKEVNHLLGFNLLIEGV